MSTSNLKNLHLKAFSTKTLQVYRVGGLGKGWSNAGERKFPSDSQPGPRSLSPSLTGAEARLCSLPLAWFLSTT